MITFFPTDQNKIAEFIYQTPIQGLFFIEHKKFEDERGFYSEIARVPEIDEQLRSPFIVKQMNFSHSQEKVARGFHAENWRKLLTVIDGEAFCAWADFRPESSTFGQVVTMTIGPESLFGSVFVDSGIGNSFCVTKGPVDYLYSVDELYAQRDTSGDMAISLFDPDLGVEWPLPKESMIISERDLAATTMKKIFPEKYE